MGLNQIRLTARCVRALSRIGAGRYLLRTLQTLPVTRAAYAACMSYQRPFKTLQEAEHAAAKYASGAHQHPSNRELLLKMSRSARPSDYAALFHIQPILPEIHNIFDLGGNVGNLFYCYSSYLEGLSKVSWRVFDLPVNIAAGEALAQERGAHQLSFTREWMDASGADLLISSGSLHYFQQTLPQMVSELPLKPTHILINRSPLTDGAPLATVQDNGAYRTACMIYNRGQLIDDFVQLGYVVDDEWKAAELSLEIPGYPECGVDAYSGMFLHLKDWARANPRGTA